MLPNGVSSTFSHFKSCGWLHSDSPGRGKVSFYNLLRIFGCLAYTHLPWNFDNGHCWNFKYYQPKCMGNTTYLWLFWTYCQLKRLFHGHNHCLWLLHSCPTGINEDTFHIWSMLYSILTPLLSVTPPNIQTLYLARARGGLMIGMH